MSFLHVMRVVVLVLVSMLPSCMSLDVVKKGNPLGLLGVPFEMAVEAVEAVDSVTSLRKPQFGFDKNVRLRGYLDDADLKSAEEMLKKGASPNFTVQGKSAVSFFAYNRDDAKAALLVKYGAPAADIPKAQAQRKADDAKKAAAELAAKRSGKGRGLSFSEQFVMNIARSLTSGSSGGGGGGGGGGSSGSSGSGAVDYTDMRVTYDQHAGSSATSGSNTINADSGRHRYSFTYYFGSNYLIPMGGDLTGRTVNVKFVGDTPVSIQSRHGVVKVANWSRR
jgi:hypothetical protein